LLGTVAEKAESDSAAGPRLCPPVDVEPWPRITWHFVNTPSFTNSAGLARICRSRRFLFRGRLSAFAERRNVRSGSSRTRFVGANGEHQIFWAFGGPRTSLNKVGRAGVESDSAATAAPVRNRNTFSLPEPWHLFAPPKFETNFSFSLFARLTFALLVPVLRAPRLFTWSERLTAGPPCGP